MSFSSSKQAAAAMEAVREMRPELTVETLKPTDSISTIALPLYTSDLNYVLYIFVSLRPYVGQVIVQATFATNFEMCHRL